MSQPSLKIIGGGKDVGDEELRQRLEVFIEEHPHLTTAVLGRSDHIGASRTALDAYLKGTYFVPKESGGLGVKPENTKIENKIRDYLDRVQGTSRHGYRNEFIETRAWQQFRHACKTSIEENAIVVVYAKPGVGKSRCLQEFATAKMTTMPISILCSANITTRYFVQKIAKNLGLDDKPPTAKLEDNVADKLKSHPRPLMIDQANYLNEKALGTICYLWEKARVPIVLIGTKDLFELFNTSRLTEDVRTQLSSRVAMHYPLMGLSIEETKTIVKRVLGDRATTNVVQSIYKATGGTLETGGNHRHLDMILPRLCQLIGKNEERLQSGETTVEDCVNTDRRKNGATPAG
jgi:DNA transposition AAA+ family ATPase